MIDLKTNNLTDAIESKIDRSKWKTYKFSDLVDNIVEKVVPKNSGLKHYIGLEHLDTGSLKIRRFGDTESLIGDKLKIYKGDLIFAKRNSYLKRVAIADFDAVASAHSMVLRPKAKNVDPNFLPFFMMSEVFWKRAIEISVGSLSPTINWKSLAKQEFLLPPKEEQAKLAELLWAMDDLIEKEKNVLNSNLVLLNSFVEDVIHGRYLNNEGVKKVSIGTIPSSWDVVKMEEVLTINDGAHFTPTYTSKGIPFLRVTDVQTTKIDLNEVKYIPLNEHETLCKRCKPEKGDILYSKNGTIGISKIIDWDWEFSIFVSLALLKIKDKNILDINYLKLILDSAHIKKEIYRKAKHGTITNLHLEEIRVFRLPLPTIEKQREIAQYVGRINNLINNCNNKIFTSQTLQKSLINQIF